MSNLVDISKMYNDSNSSIRTPIVNEVDTKTRREQSEQRIEPNKSETKAMINTTNKVVAKEALIMNRFAILADEFNRLKQSETNVNVLAAKVKEMRIEHGKIVDSFYKTIREDGKFTEPEYYVLSTLDSSMTNMRYILNEAEAFIGQPKEVTISTGTSTVSMPKAINGTPTTSQGKDILSGPEVTMARRQSLQGFAGTTSDDVQP